MRTLIHGGIDDDRRGALEYGAELIELLLRPFRIVGLRPTPRALCHSRIDNNVGAAHLRR